MNAVKVECVLNHFLNYKRGCLSGDSDIGESLNTLRR